MLAKSTKYVRAALGLHPQVVGEFYHEVDSLCDLIPEARYIGEIGLDGSPEYASSLDLQKNVLHKILLSCAANGGRIMSLHSRGATREVLDMLDIHKKAGTPILHWFSGNLKELDRAINMGCWFSVGPAMVNSKKGLEIVERIPINKLLTETDGPFTKLKGKILMPWDTEVVINHLTRLWKKDSTAVQKQILTNLNCLCS